MFEREIESDASPAAVYRQLPVRPGRVLLDEIGRGRSRRTLLGHAPKTWLEWRGSRGFVRRREGGTDRATDFVAALRGLLLSLESRASAVEEGDFAGGLMGLFGYDLRLLFEDLPDRNPPDSSLPDCYVGAFDHWLVHDESRPGMWTFRALETGAATEDRFAAVRRLVEQAGDVPAFPERSTPRPARSNLARADYLAAVERIRELIREGEVYQVNFSQRFLLPLEAEPIVVYERVRDRHAAPWGGLVERGSAALSCHSPEIFLEVDGDRVRTQPIKGTIGRSPDPVEDLRRAVELASSEKDRAELAMIVDLMRNDLGRVCRPGSIEVRDHARIESAPTVHHLVTSVVGRLEEGRDVFDLLAATWPGGSITGAPKIRAMAVIDELETLKRGPYTGSIGRIGLDGCSRLNIAIRSIVLEGGHARVHGGGGIVIDSDPEHEYAESIVKVKGLLEALGAEIVQ